MCLLKRLHWHIFICLHKMKYFFKLLALLFSLNFIDASQSFRCDYKYSSAAKGWFKHFVIPATWFDARLRCALEGATLASPTTEEIEAEMTHIVKNFFTAESEIFTGIHATFSQGDFYTVEGVPLSEIPIAWNKNEPDNDGNHESCITFNGNGDLADHPCEDTRPYICYRADTEETKVNECGTVDSEYHLDTRTNSCYKFHVVPRNFARAFFACSAEGGHLAIINSETEATVLKEIFAKYRARDMIGKFWKDVAFVGFHDWGEKIEWRTIHGQTLWRAGYSKFSAGEPNNASPGESCGSIYRSGKLNDLWCDRPAAFICEKSPNFPAVCKAVLEEAETTKSNSTK